MALAKGYLLIKEDNKSLWEIIKEIRPGKRRGATQLSNGMR
jgi:hypothetical protein